MYKNLLINCTDTTPSQIVSTANCRRVQQLKRIEYVNVFEKNRTPFTLILRSLSFGRNYLGILFIPGSPASGQKNRQNVGRKEKRTGEKIPNDKIEGFASLTSIYRNAVQYPKKRKKWEWGRPKFFRR